MREEIEKHYNLIITELMTEGTNHYFKQYIQDEFALLVRTARENISDLPRCTELSVVIGKLFDKNITRDTYYEAVQLIAKIRLRDEKIKLEHINDAVIRKYASNRLLANAIRIKNMTNRDFHGVNLSDVNFTDFTIMQTNLNDTKANIDPQRIFQKNLSKNQLENLDFSDYSFNDVNISESSLKNSIADIDPQTISGKNLYKTNLENVNFSGKNFDGVNIGEANLKGTKAIINPQTIINKDLVGTNLRGLDLSEADFTGVTLTSEKSFKDGKVMITNLSNTNAKVNPQLVTNKDLSHVNLENCDLSNFDFNDVILFDTNLSNSGAKIDPQLVHNKSLNYCNLEGLNLCDADFTGISIKNTNLRGTGAIIKIDDVLDFNIQNAINYVGCVIDEYFIHDISDFYAVKDKLSGSKMK